MHSRLSICLYVSNDAIAIALSQWLGDDRYWLTTLNSPNELLNFVSIHTEQIDCLIALRDPAVFALFNHFYEQGKLLPLIILETGLPPDGTENSETPTFLYHSAEIRHRVSDWQDIPSTIERAIAQFLNLGPSCSLTERPFSDRELNSTDTQPTFLLSQQHRLAEKLKERLGYLGVYYKRNSSYFYRNLPKNEKLELLSQVKTDYRQIVLYYFSKDPEVNQAIDQMVNRAFFADISVSQILEIHMELMDEFAQQLKLEGRSEEILLDYRLTLIDILAHLGEMYRRSIPREDIPAELFSQID